MSRVDTTRVSLVGSLAQCCECKLFASVAMWRFISSSRIRPVRLSTRVETVRTRGRRTSCSHTVVM